MEGDADDKKQSFSKRTRNYWGRWKTLFVCRRNSNRFKKGENIEQIMVDFSDAEENGLKDALGWNFVQKSFEDVTSISFKGWSR